MEQDAERIVKTVWLNHINACLYHDGVITKDEYDRMILKIAHETAAAVADQRHNKPENDGTQEVTVTKER